MVKQYVREDLLKTVHAQVHLLCCVLVYRRAVVENDGFNAVFHDGHEEAVDVLAVRCGQHRDDSTTRDAAEAKEARRPRGDGDRRRHGARSNARRSSGPDWRPASRVLLLGGTISS